MKKIKSGFAPKLLLSTTCVILAGTSGLVHALDAKVSGQVNRAVMFMDDGENSKAAFIDNANSNSRFRFVGSGDINEDLKAGVKWEIAFRSNSSGGANPGARDPGFAIGERHQDVWFSGGFGKLSIGQGDGAANGATEKDLSGTGVASYSGQGDLGGGIDFIDKTTMAPSAFSIGSTMSNLDFESRFDRVRYDAPKVGPLSLSFAVGTKGSKDVVDAAVRLSETMGDTKIAAALGYSSNKVGGAAGSRDTIGFSVSALASNGANLTLAYAAKGDDNPVSAAKLDAKNVYVKAGFKSGIHAVSIDYMKTSDLSAGSDIDSNVFGVQYVAKPVGWAELYAAVKVHSLDLPTGAADVDDITVATVGSRLKF